jgi:hypothetical protein
MLVAGLAASLGSTPAAASLKTTHHRPEIKAVNKSFEWLLVMQWTAPIAGSQVPKCGVVWPITNVSSWLQLAVRADSRGRLE